MQNKILANDWLEDGKKHPDVACTMQKDSYYNDIIGLELQQGALATGEVEKKVIKI
jgi:hypothetical protein